MIALPTERIPSNVQVQDFLSPTGVSVRMALREDTIDHDIAMSNITEDEYHLGSRGPLEGWAIDIGTSIGPVAITLALANPGLRVLAVDVVPENIAMTQHNVELNGVQDRVTVLHRAAGGPDEATRVCYMRHTAHPAATEAYVNKHRYIGNSFWSVVHGKTVGSDAVEMPVYGLGALLREFGIDEVAFLKTDCEGCEWAVLDTPEVKQLRYIVGEYHWDYIGQRDVATLREDKPIKRAKTAQKELARLLGKTHDLTVDEHPSIGHFSAVLR